jgi:hypothetical protein
LQTTGVPAQPFMPQESPVVHASPSSHVPSFAAPHVPSDPMSFFDAAHAWHTPLHAELQQTPSAQKPEPQSVPTVHGAPVMPRGLHEPATHVNDGMQSASLAHGFVHAAPLHT